jgi:metal-responsive CopG/Arc/MetJ family transcriptional regulator
MVVIKRNKKALNVSISNDLFDFLDQMVKEHEFASWSHGVELALARLKKEKEKEREREGRGEYKLR